MLSTEFIAICEDVEKVVPEPLYAVIEHIPLAARVCENSPFHLHSYLPEVAVSVSGIITCWPFAFLSVTYRPV